MKSRFSVQVESFRTLKEIQGAWQPSDYDSLLKEMEFGDTSQVSEDELLDLCLMSLQDLKPSEAATLLLNYKLKDRLTRGQIQNSSHEMMDEKLWEEFADLSLHEQMFNIGSLLYKVSPKLFPEPDAAQVALLVEANNETAKEFFASSCPEALIVRLLADGMDDGAALHRMFDDQLAGQKFPEADKIVWIVETESLSPEKKRLKIISSGYWLDALQDAEHYVSSAYPDKP